MSVGRCRRKFDRKKKQSNTLKADSGLTMSLKPKGDRNYSNI